MKGILNESFIRPDQKYRSVKKRGGSRLEVAIPKLITKISYSFHPFSEFTALKCNMNIVLS